MFLLIKQNISWKDLHIKYTRSADKDYSHYENAELEVFTYGYPYHQTRSAWALPQEIAQMYSQKGTDLVNDIEGSFAIIILDKAKEVCNTIIDPCGAYNLFYTKDKDNFVISDNIKEIVPHLSIIKLNLKSVIEFLSFAFVLGNKTHIQDIYRFKPATIYSMNKNLEVQEKIYWELPPRNERPSKNNLKEIFNQHIEKGLNLDASILSPLTGGIDTRTILSACLGQKEKLSCYTHGFKVSKDIKIARKIARRFNIKYNTVLLDKEWIKNIPSLIEKSEENYNGMLNIIPWLHLKTAYEKQKNEGELFFVGTMGNEIWRQEWVNPNFLKTTSVDALSSKIVKRLLQSSIVDIYKSYKPSEVRGLLKSSVQCELSKKTGEDVPTNLDHFAIENFAANRTAYVTMLIGKYFKVFNCLVSRKLLETISQFDFMERRTGTIQKHIILKNAPRFKKILLLPGIRLEGPGFIPLKNYPFVLWTYFKLGINQLSKKLLKKNMFKSVYLADYPNWLRKYHKDYVLKMLDYQNMVSKELFKEKELKKAINDFLGGDDSFWFSITALISLEVWLKKILGEKRNV